MPLLASAHQTSPRVVNVLRFVGDLGIQCVITTESA
jgi:hypothetical protein